MRVGRWVACVLAAVFAVGAVPVFAQEDEGPILHPQPKPKPPTSAILLVTCDLACNWNLDDGSDGHLEAGGAAKVNAAFGRHSVAAATEDALDKAEIQIDIRPVGHTAAHFALQAVRDARLQAEQAARDKAEQEARDKAAQEARDRAEQEAREKAAREQQEKQRQARQPKPAAVSGSVATGLRPGAPRAEQKAIELYNQGRYLGASQFFEQACNAGNGEGCDRLGQMYGYGTGVAKNTGRSFAYYSKACELGNVDGCVSVGAFYEEGVAVGQDLPRAVEIYSKSCAAGSPAACTDLGLMAKDGRGISQDYLRAAGLFAKACNAGDALGCANLGVSYREGLGVNPDRKMARELFYKACSMRNQWGCNQLRKMQ